MSSGPKPARTAGRLRARLSACARDDAGFSLVEAVVSALVLALFSTGVYTVLLTTLGISRIDRQRVAASSLAQREVEIARGIVARPACPGSTSCAVQLVTAGTVVNPSPLSGIGPSLVDGVPYTVTRTAQWAVRGTGSSSCDGGTAVQYPNVQVGVTVTWPGMRSVAPVVSSTVIAPPKNVLSSSYAFVAVAVNTYTSSPAVGRTVSASGPASQVQTTDSSGCAVFGLATAGAYTFTLNDPGWVDSAGNVSSSTPLTVSSGTFSSLAMTYDRSGTLAATLTPPTGYPLPMTAVDVSLYNVKLPGPTYTRSAATTNGAATFADVAPWSDGYVVYAGSCSDANPVLAPTSGSRPSAVVAAGGSATAAPSLAPVHVQYSPAAGGAVAGLAVTATSQATTCPSSQRTLTLGTTGAGGGLDVCLPFGRWTVTVAGRTSGVITPQATGALTTATVT
jgi:hypothetical protein